MSSNHSKQAILEGLLPKLLPQPAVDYLGKNCLQKKLHVIFLLYLQWPKIPHLKQISMHTSIKAGISWPTSVDVLVSTISIISIVKRSFTKRKAVITGDRDNYGGGCKLKLSKCIPFMIPKCTLI